MYAVIENGGKQYRVTPGETVQLETVVGDVGSQVEFSRVLAVMGLNRGGDPELDEEGELFVAKALVGKPLGAPPASLADETTDLRSLGA